MSDPCTHDRIVHETKKYVYCKACKIIMTRLRGDWIPDPNEVARRKEQNDAE